jgi:hypothetical protein
MHRNLKVKVLMTTQIRSSYSFGFWIFALLQGYQRANIQEALVFGITDKIVQIK